MAMHHQAPSGIETVSHGSYAKWQLLFWGGYLVINLVFMGLWGAKSLYLLVLFGLLSTVLGGISHGLRYLYKRHTDQWPLYKIILHLIWLLPLSALVAQVFLVGISSLMFLAFPSLNTNNPPLSLSSLLGYAINYCIMLTLWCTIYLLRAEFTKRRHSEIAHWKLQAQLKDNELQFLRSQINSHFLFNAINNLRTLIIEDPEAARKGLESLSALLRGVIQNNAQPLVSLRDELEWVKGYLFLESLQFENRLTTIWDIDDSLLNAKLPPLVLQTLVENAIKHGIAARRQGGELRISVKRSTNDQWEINVQNPPPEFTPHHTGNKVGLQNTRERLLLAFGNSASLDLIFSSDITARVQLPL